MFALPQWHWSDLGLRVTQKAYFLLITHTKQLLLVMFCDPTAGTGVSFRTDARTHGRTDGGRTDRRGSRNSYLDLGYFQNKYCKTPFNIGLRLWCKCIYTC